MRRRVKRAISLIEVVISMGLIVLLISSLFFWYRAISKQRQDFSQLLGPLMEERYAYQRLQQLFSSVEMPLFTASDGGLVFIFDRGLFPQPELSGKVLGRIYYDAPQRCLCLGLWPYPMGNPLPTIPSQAIILLDRIDHFQIEFYQPPDLFKKPVDPETVGTPRPQERWQNSWLSSYTHPPAMIKLTITREEIHPVKEHTLEYRFALPSLVFYPKEVA